MLDLPAQYYQELERFQDIVVTVSGGIDSTAIALDLFERGYKFTMLYNNTGRCMKSARETLVALFKLTKMPFIITYPYVDQKSITEKTKDELIKFFESGKIYNKKMFSCCRLLKEKPYLDWIRKNRDQSIVFILGLARYEGMNRRIRLIQIMKQNTFLRFKKIEKSWFIYPLRDWKDEKFLVDYVRSHPGFENATHSGCVICPVLTLFEIPGEEERTLRSQRVFNTQAIENVV